MKINKIILGVTQFGMRYGIMNKFNINRKQELKKILNFSKKNKIKYLYTSKYYGNSNKLLEYENLNYFEIFTKFKAEDLLKDNIIFEINKIKIKLKKKNLILLIDGFEKLNIKKSTNVHNRLKSLKKSKYISKFGYSIYSFINLKKICNNFKPDILQCPYSIIDRRLEKNRFLQYLKNKKIEVHVRSIFLQGLLLIDPSKLPKKFLKWKDRFKIFKYQMSMNGVNNLDACINFIQNNKYIDKILIGVDNLNHLKEIVSAKSYIKIKFPNIHVENRKLIDPSKW